MIEIEKRLNNVNKVEMSSFAFGILGLSGLIINQPVLTALLSVSFPWMITSALSKHSMKKDNYRVPSQGLFSYFYNKSLKNWLYNYLDQSENITEKKYKLLFTFMWMKSKNISPDILEFYNDNKLSDLLDKLVQSKETKCHLEYLFIDSKIGCQTLLMEDRVFPEKIMIAKKVYQDFAEAGLFGKSFGSIHSDNFEALSSLQDYQISNADIVQIEKLLNREKLFRQRIDTFLLDEKQHLILEKLITNQMDNKKLDILETYIKLWDDPELVKVYLSRINSKRFNDDLENKLATHDEELPKKRMKI